VDALLGTLGEAELATVREAQPDRLIGLDEDELLALHARVRHARVRRHPPICNGAEPPPELSAPAARPARTAPERRISCPMPRHTGPRAS
jgi:hypothetical protein